MKCADTDTRAKLISTAGWIALIGNLILALVKLLFGLFAHSLAVIGDGIDSSTDVAIALMALIVSNIIARPSDKEHPWGHGRAETTATMLLACIICFAGIQLFFSSVQTLVQRSYAGQTSAAALFAAGLSIAGKLLLAGSQYYFGKKADSPMILANAQNMKNDIIMSLSVFAGIGSAKLFSMPVIDPAIALLISIWIIKNAVILFKEMNTELMDGNTDEELYKKLFEAVRSVKGASNPHRARIRKLATHWDIDIDIEVNADMTVHEAHLIAEQTERAIRNAIPDIYDIVVHIEPAGYAEHYPEEQYGLSEQDITGN